jgi:hypothetical protein
VILAESAPAQLARERSAPTLAALTVVFVLKGLAGARSRSTAASWCFWFLVWGIALAAARRAGRRAA